MPKSPTTSVTAYLTFDSSQSTPPFAFTGSVATIIDASGGLKSTSNWAQEKIDNPDATKGASFTINLTDANGSTLYSDIKNWVVTFVPRSPTTDASPFGPNTSLSGSGAALVNGLINLDFGKARIKHVPAGTAAWDWSLLVQVNVGGTIRCYASDPEMDVDPTSILGGPGRRARGTTPAVARKRRRRR
jgi:hypothetical protein